MDTWPRWFPRTLKCSSLLKATLCGLAAVFVLAGGIFVPAPGINTAWAQDSAVAKPSPDNPANNSSSGGNRKAAPLPKHAGAAAKPGVGSGKPGSKTKQADDNSPFPEFSNNHGPINIRSDSLALDYKNNTVLFSGHVRVVQAGGVLTSNSLLVKYNKSNQVERAVADGNVRMSQGGRWVTSDHAVLDQSNHTVVLTGNPVAHNGDDQVTGNKITVYLQSGRSVVDGDARAVFFPRPSKNGDNRVSGQTIAGVGAHGGNQVLADPVR